MRGLFAYAKKKRNKKAKEAAFKASEIFLKRKLFRGVHNNNVMHSDFKKLMYPYYWYYSILFGLRVLSEGGLIEDSRCAEALDIIESKRLPDGFFPAERKKYRKAVKSQTSGSSPVDWGGVNTTKANEWITVDVLSVLKAAGRLT